jgi:putative component of membrane protein insertase Oxa1/YidC/SpoIIIJ protein YidD
MARHRLGKLAAWLVWHIWQQESRLPHSHQSKTACHLYPSCSEFAAQALERHGIIEGVSLTINRVRRCRSIDAEAEQVIDFP